MIGLSDTFNKWYLSLGDERRKEVDAVIKGTTGYYTLIWLSLFEVDPSSGGLNKDFVKWIDELVGAADAEDKMKALSAVLVEAVSPSIAEQREGLTQKTTMVSVGTWKSEIKSLAVTLLVHNDRKPCDWASFGPLLGLFWASFGPIVSFSYHLAFENLNTVEYTTCLCGRLQHTVRETCSNTKILTNY